MGSSAWKQNLLDRKIFEQQGRCHYCSRAVNFSRLSSTPTLDEKLPRCRGGGQNRRNSVMACWHCNNQKGALTEAEFFAAYNAGGYQAVAAARKVMNRVVNGANGALEANGSYRMGTCSMMLFLEGPGDRGASMPPDHPHVRVMVWHRRTERRRRARVRA